MNDERRILTRSEADELMPPGEYVHTLMQAPAAGLVLMGADHDRESILKLADDGKLELAGEAARGMKHGIAALDKPYAFFVETIETHPLLQ